MNGNAITPLDGRYADKTRALSPYFSEKSLMKYRVMVEVEYFIALSNTKGISLRRLSTSEIKFLKNLYLHFNENSYKLIKKFEEETRQDIKAVEYFIKEKISKTSLGKDAPWIHFGLTSEDVNNVAYAMMLSDALDKIIKPKIENIAKILNTLAQRYTNLSMLARTHGQSASPTTFGKEMKVFVVRVEYQLKSLNSLKIQAKLNGATGNYNAHISAYPKVDWPKFSQKFIESFNKNRKLKLEVDLFTTQIESYDSYITIFDNLKRINTILLDLDQDMWRYISDEWVNQIPNKGETGSSTMPHKINPIDFENSEGNFGLANALFEFFARKLPVSRLQRDLSDSTVKRSLGSAFGYSYLGYLSLTKGLSKISLNRDKIKEDLSKHPEVIAEAIQTILRREGQENAYEILKDLTRGKKIELLEIHQFINDLDINKKVKKELLSLAPENYTGLASRLASK